MRICRSVYLRGRIWWGKYRLPDSPLVRISLGTDSKQVAEARLLDKYREAELEQCGLIPTKLVRESGARPLLEHLKEYLDNLRILGRSAKHVEVSKTRISTVLEQCKWQYIRDVTPDSFGLWRSRQVKLSAKTLNEYLNLSATFFSWMVSQGRMTGNPLKNVQRVDTRGKERIIRRAFLFEELRRLVKIQRGNRGLVYFFAAYTGLRRREMQLLRWSDLVLEGEMPCVRVRAATTKNRRNTSIPLHPDLVDAMRDYQRGQRDLSGMVFPSIPKSSTVETDLEQVGIVKVDDDGRKVDFHALRKTFATMLNQHGVGARMAMELMRHSDMSLTHKVYTDESVLPLSAEVRRLPSIRI